MSLSMRIVNKIDEFNSDKINGEKSTVQRKIFKGCKFHRFHCLHSKHKNYYHRNEWTASHVATIMPVICKIFSAKSKFNKSAKFIAREIIICAVPVLYFPRCANSN